MQMITCTNCGEHFAATYSSCPACNTPSPVRRASRKGGKRLAGKRQSPAPKAMPDPSPQAAPDPKPPAGASAPPSGAEPSSGPPKRNVFLRRFFVFCSILLIIAAALIVVSIAQTLFGDKGTPSPEASPPIASVSPAPSGDADALTGIAISPTEVPLSAPGDTARLSVIAQPETAQIGSVSWNSRDPDVATVDETGLVTAVSEGRATITATAGEQLSACIVTVGASASAPPNASSTPTSDGPSLSRTDFTLASASGESYRLRVSGGEGGVVWAVKDSSVATVSETGLVTAVSRGTTTVTATVDGKTLKCVVRVR